ncbi:MAG: hypothetical protein CMH49_05590 [Myxococcales bacterium]|nr:hypothetical protein [Myxococcales bacterium]
MYQLIKTVVWLMLSIYLLSCATLSDPLPEGQKGEKAEQLAQKVLKALNAEAFFQAQGAKWSFRGRHYIWHKGLNRVRVQLGDDLFAYVDLNLQKGWAFQGQQRLDSQAEANTIQKAIKAFNNDSFWAFAPFKIIDSGTQRALVHHTQSSEHPSPTGLLVFYESGGTTPGDHYLWHLDPTYRPYKWQMWVSIIPVGGVSSSWAKWKKTQSGAWVAQEHSLGPVTFKVKHLEVVTHFEDLSVKVPKLLETWPKRLSF